MTVLAWPSLLRPAPPSVEWALVANTQVFVSPLSNAAQTVEMPGARWRVSFTLENIEETDAAVLQAFMAKLRGRAGRFTLHNFSRPRPRGVGSGSPLVNGAGQTGVSLVTDGWTVSTSGLLVAGDYIGVNGELKIVVASVDSDAGGNATITFEPPLRSAPNDNAAIILEKPTAVFSLEDDAMRWLARPAHLSDVPIVAVETWS